MEIWKEREKYCFLELGCLKQEVQSIHGCPPPWRMCLFAAHNCHAILLPLCLISRPLFCALVQSLFSKMIRSSYCVPLYLHSVPPSNISALAALPEICMHPTRPAPSETPKGLIEPAYEIRKLWSALHPSTPPIICASRFAVFREIVPRSAIPAALPCPFRQGLERWQTIAGVGTCVAK
jgi:hypothetical protein